MSLLEQPAVIKPDKLEDPARLSEQLAKRYQEVRKFSEELCAPLATEDYVVQSMPDVSPTKWHLAHVSWFFETFLVAPNLPGYTSPNPMYNYLFNSYYNAIGERHARPRRGLLTRPTVAETYHYRQHVDRFLLELLQELAPAELEKLAPILVLGLHHEQQHQELILTDLKHVLSCNPLRPAYRPDLQVSATTEKVPELEWLSYPEGIYWIGLEETGQPKAVFDFAFDNEGPYHRQFVPAFQLASRLVTNGEYLEFIEAGGYTRPDLWLSDGWYTVQQEGWQAPLYWEKQDGHWWFFTLGGMREVNPAEPVCHLSYYEADAFARWAGARLPTEAEWELVAREVSPEPGNFVEAGAFHPVPLSPEKITANKAKPSQLYGDVWEWTQSAYLPYPGYAPAEGALGEYNGKFMCNQFVLRGGSCATSLSHIRPTYRNFFPPSARWQFSGLRLARDL
jgi:ergothioneine biosynthesis protein EgtB